MLIILLDGFVDFDSPQAASQALSTINAEGMFEAEMAKEIRGRSIDRVSPVPQVLLSLLAHGTGPNQFVYCKLAEGLHRILH